ncbi:MAG: signal recognition particle-docking protein FtsY [Mycoplasmatota bacterium]
MGLFNKFTKLFTKEKEVIDYDKGLEKTRNELNSSIKMLSKKHKQINESYYEELEEILIMADIGVNTVMTFIDKLKSRIKKENIENTEDLVEIIVDEMFIVYVSNQILSDKINYQEEGPTVILFVGVNGVGKTTTLAKLAHKLKMENKKVLLVAADTFRAGAIEQLIEWSKKTKTDIVYKENTEPSAVIYEGTKKATEENYDVVLIDTAGRLQNKVNLMEELNKINKVIGKNIPGAPHETLLVIDATTGQNGISQAKNFKEITNITGIALTKLDGTAKGGIVLAIKEAVEIPVKFIGLGEKMDDLKPFDIEKYIYGLFKDLGE